MKCNLLLVFLTTCILMISDETSVKSQSHPATKEGVEQQRKPRVGPLGFSNIVEITELFEATVPWTEASPSTVEEWIPIVRAAISVQHYEPIDIQSAIVLFLDRQLQKTVRAGRPLSEYLRSMTRIMLILRIAFDIPTDAAPKPIADVNAMDGEGFHATVCGGTPWHVRDGEKKPAPSYSLPVRWLKTGPTLVAFPEKEFAGRGPMYEPHIEYRYFLSNFPFREGLREWIERNERPSK